MEAKLDQIANDITEIKVTQGKQHESLVYHIKRTDILEEHVKPVIEFRAHVLGAFKLISLIALGVGMVEGIVALLEYLNV